MIGHAPRNVATEPFLPRFLIQRDRGSDRGWMLWRSNATEVSNLSHKFLGWIYAKDGETIPYNVALVSKIEPTHEQLESAQRLEGYAKEVIGL